MENYQISGIISDKLSNEDYPNIQRLTTIPAQMCGIEDQVGTLEIGKLANFVIADNDPFEKECDFYSVWTAGEIHKLKDLPTTDFCGTYKMNLLGAEYTLNLTGRKLSGQLKQDDWTTDISKITTDRNRIVFSSKVDSTDNMVHFSGRKVSNKISGRWLFPDGKEGNWTAIASTGKTDSTENPDDTETEPDEAEHLVSRLTYPNKAFGLEILPALETILFRKATIWTADDTGIIENCDLLISSGLIQAVGPDLQVGSDVKVFDATGKHIIPGIIDAHSHLAISGDVNEGTFSITPEVRIGDVTNPDQVSMYRQIAGGVTTCLSLHGSANPIGGQCQVIKLRWGSNAEQLKFTEAPPTIKFAMGENVKQSGWGEKHNTRYPQTRMGVTNIMADWFQAAVEYREKWHRYDQLSNKVKSKTIPPRKDIQLETLLEVLDDNMLVHCHTYVQTEILALMRLAEKFGFGIDVFIHNLEGYKVADEMAAHGVGVTTFSDWWSYKFEVYDAIPYNTALIAERGVVTSVNSDDINLGCRLNLEASKAIMYGGMDQTEAIKLITINPARQLGIDHVTGSIKKGKMADIVIYNGNPLSIYSRVEQTWIDGKKYFEIESDAIQRDQITVEKNKLIQKLLDDSKKKNKPEKDKKRHPLKPPDPNGEQPQASTYERSAR